MGLHDMDGWQVAVGLGTLAVTIYIYSSFTSPRITRHGRPLKRPPNTLPLVGNGLYFLRARQTLLAWFVRCERQLGYETVHISVPTLPPGVILHDPRNVDFVFRNEGVFEKGDFVKRRTLALFGHGIINVDGPLWRAQRRAGLHFLGARNLRVLTDVALPRYLGDAVRELRRAGAAREVLDLQAVMMELTAQLVGKMAYDMEMHAGDDFTRAFDRASGYTAERFQNPLWFLTEPVFGASFRACLRTIKAFGRDIVASAVASAAAAAAATDKEDATELDTVSGSLIQSLLSALGDEELVADAALNYLSAGRDTIAQALTWTFYMLQRHQPVAQKLQSVLRDALGEAGDDDAAPIDPERLTPTALPYVTAVFYETLRLYPPVPLEIKQVQQATALPDGTLLPRTSVVVFCAWALGRSRTTWGPDADEFRPERWLAGGRFVGRPAGEFPVFNGGPRLCVGKRMAELVAVHVIAVLARSFVFEPAYEGERVSKSSLTLPMKGGLPVYVRRIDRSAA
ncbi:hypothetical protein S40288_06163 [Stachybotrys chartarum IBT 40288]|nr:hypothetical protein S40288_06163 [Stachybotrys chartarum IBT 40288]